MISVRRLRFLASEVLSVSTGLYSLLPDAITRSGSKSPLLSKIRTIAVARFT